MSSSEADSYGLVLPVEWIEVPTDGSDFGRFRDDVLAQVRRIDGWTRTIERKLELLLGQVEYDLKAADARIAAVIADTEETAGGLALAAAGVTVSRVDKSSLGSRVPLTTDSLIAALGQEPRNGAKVSYVNLQPAELVSLPAGLAVRVLRHYTATPAPAQVIEYYADIFLVPHDGGEAVCAVQFTTPNVEDGSAFSKLFEAIAKTLRIFMPGDPTDFSDPASGE